MADLSTSFMGVKLTSPVIMGACTLTGNIDNVKRAQDAGAGAVTAYSLFQEQIELERNELEEELLIGAERFSESITYFPQMDHAGPREHVMWVEKTKKAIEMPVFGSLNARTPGSWVEYAKQLENAGVDGLELNIYSIETDPSKTAADIEERNLDVIADVKAHVSIPVAVKLSPWYTSLANFAHRIANIGADGLILFNRFYQPTIDPDTESIELSLDLSTPQESRLPLRWVGILSGSLSIDLAASTGIHSGEDVIRQLLAGSRATQTVSSLYLHGIGHIAEMNQQISDWMDKKGYKSIEEFRGKLSESKVSDPWAFERAQYIKILFGHEKRAKYGQDIGYWGEHEK